MCHCIGLVYNIVRGSHVRSEHGKSGKVNIIRGSAARRGAGRHGDRTESVAARIARCGALSSCLSFLLRCFHLLSTLPASVGPLKTEKSFHKDAGETIDGSFGILDQFITKSASIFAS